MFENIALLVLFQIVGLLEMLLALPLLLGRVDRSGTYGFRTTKSLSSDDRWYAANRYAGKALLVAGSLLFTGMSFLWPFVAHVGLLHILVAGLLTTTVPLAAGVWASFRYLKRLP